MQEALTTKLADVQHVMSTFRTQFMEKIADVNTHLHAIRENLTLRLASIDGYLDIKASDIKTVLSTFRTQFVEKIGS